MAELKQAERMAMVREKVRTVLAIPENAVKIGTETYVIETENGFGKVVISAIKGEFDPEEAKAEYEFQLEEARVKAEKRKAEAEAKKQANLAKKAKAKAEKEA